MSEWVLVPVEPTVEMCEALHTAMFQDPFDGQTLPMLGAGLDAALVARPPIPRAVWDAMMQ